MNNTSLTDLQLLITTFDVANVHEFRTALRLNGALTNVSFDLGGIQLDTTTLLPLGDRCKLRTALHLNAPAQSGDTAEHCDVRFYVPLSDVQQMLMMSTICVLEETMLFPQMKSTVGKQLF